MRDTQMQGANFMGARMQGAYLLLARMQGTDLHGAKMQGAIFNKTAIDSSPNDSQNIRVFYADSAQPFFKINLDLEGKFLHDPKVIWEEVIPELDADEHVHQDSLLAAARGIKRNFEGCGSTKKYLEEIDATFCNSERLKELCSKQPRP